MSETRVPDMFEILVDRQEARTDVTCIFRTSGEEFIGRGMARRKATDPPYPAIGYQLALSRALQELSNDLARAAQRKIDALLPKE